MNWDSYKRKWTHQSCQHMKICHYTTLWLMFIIGPTPSHVASFVLPQPPLPVFRDFYTLLNDDKLLLHGCHGQVSLQPRLSFP